MSENYAPPAGVKKFLLWLGGVLAAVGTACQIAGVNSVILAYGVLVFGIWIFTSAEVWFSNWAQRAGRYKPCVLAVVCCVSGCCTLWISGMLTNYRLHATASQTEATSPKPTEHPSNSDHAYRLAQPHVPTVEVLKATQCPSTGDRPYSGCSNVQLGQWVIDESDKVLKMASSVYERRSTGNAALDETTLHLAKISFSMELKTCCLSDMEAMRKEAIARVGPYAKNADEQSLWELISSEANNNQGTGRISPMPVQAYAPHLKILGEQLRSLKALESR
jgi:hypothetical protein